MYQQERVEPSCPWTGLSTSPDNLGFHGAVPNCSVGMPTSLQDVSRGGQLSDQLRALLQHYDVEAIGEILKSRHLTTVNDLQMMRDSKKADVLSVAQIMYTKVLGALTWTEKRKMNLMIMFPIIKSNGTPTASGRDEKKKKETVLKQSLQSVHFMESAEKCFGTEKMADCQHYLEQSESLSRISFWFAAQAYTVVASGDFEPSTMWQDENGQWWETHEMTELKALRANLRDVVAWRLIGFILGMDSRESAELMLHDALDDHDSGNPGGTSSYAAVLNAFLTIQRDVMRAICLIPCREANFGQSPQNYPDGQGSKVSAPGVTKDISKIQALLTQVQQQVATLQAEVDQMNTQTNKS